MLRLFRREGMEDRRMIAGWVRDVERSIKATSGEELVVDVSGVETINSAELGLLIQIRMRLHSNGRRMVLANAGASLCEFFSATRVDRLIDVRSSQLTTQ